AQIQFSIYFYLLQDPIGAAQILQNGYILAAEAGGSATLEVAPDQTLSVAGITVGPGGTLVDSGTIHASVALLGGSAGAAIISQDGRTLISQDGSSLISQDGSSLFAQNLPAIAAVSGQSLVGNTTSPVVSNDGGSVVSNDGGSVVSN